MEVGATTSSWRWVGRGVEPGERCKAPIGSRSQARRLVQGWGCRVTLPQHRRRSPAGHRKRTDTSLAISRPRRVSTQRSPSRSTRPGSSSPSRASTGHAGRACAATAAGPRCARRPASSVSPAASVERPARDRGDVALGRAQVPPPPAGAVRVGGAAEPEVVVLAPVEEVVAALVAGPGPVRHLVVGQARRAVSRSSASSYSSAWTSSSGCRAGSSASGVPASTVSP